MNETSGGFGSYAELFRRRRNWIITIVPASLLISVYLAYALPPQYRSTATIILEPSSIQQEIIQTTVANYADQQIEIISGRVMEPGVLQSLVKEYDPYPEATNLTVEQKAHRLLTDIQLLRVDPVTLEPLEKSPAFSLFYQNPNPLRAADVTQRLADLFLTYHQRERTRAAQKAEKMISDRADELNEELRKLDVEYAELRAKHGDLQPDSAERNEASRERAERDLEDAERQLRAAQQQQSLLSIQLNGLSPNLLASRGGDPSLKGDSKGELKGDLTDLVSVRAQLADAEMRYTPDHPDVKRLRRALATLMQQQDARKSSGKASQIQADNPEYERVASQLQAADKDVAALQMNVQRDMADLTRYNQLLHVSPEIQQEFNDLLRRRDALQRQFADVQSKLKSAEMGQRFEAEKQGEHFSEVRAPFPASSPYYPNRLGLILLGLVLGGTLTSIAVAVAESSDATIRGAKDILPDEKLPLLGGIPEIVSPADYRRRRLVWSTAIAAYALAGSFVALTVINAQIRDGAAVQAAPSPAQESKPL